MTTVSESVSLASPKTRAVQADPRWVRPALLALLAATGLLYLVGLSSSGWANSFYSAAVQAGATSWKAWFFGSFDAANFITVDKPPAALWVMGLSARIFGVNSWSILVPQALEGIAAVGLLYATVRRRFGPAAGLLAGAVLAVTPVSALMFRFNNPDALLVLLLVGAAYALTRAMEEAGTRWLVLVGLLVGTGFLTKMLQAFIVVPGFALVYLIAAPTSLRRRVGQLLAAGAALVVASGWWVAVVMLWPASSRPYIGGSTDNSVLDLIFGYNGLGRLNGNEAGSVVGGGGQGQAGAWGETGLLRLFNSEIGAQISWLLPAALIFLVLLLWMTWRAPRTDRGRAAVLLWGSWLVVTGLTFSYMQGIFHAYYTVALAPAIGALVGIGAVTLWQRRESFVVRTILAATVAMTVIWTHVLLSRAEDWHPWLRQLIVVVGVLGVLGILLAPYVRGRLLGLVAGVALAASLTGPAAYAIDTASTPHTGAIPSAGPATFGGGPGGGPGGAPGGGQRQMFGPGGPPQGGGGMPPQGVPQGGAMARPGGGPGGAGGLLDAGTPSQELIDLLSEDADSYTWAAATIGSNSAAGVQLAIDAPVMAIGGFNGTDPAPTLEEFQQLVAAGEIHYYLEGGGMQRESSSDINSWVEANFTAQTIDGQTVYDLSR